MDGILGERSKIFTNQKREFNVFSLLIGYRLTFRTLPPKLPYSMDLTYEIGLSDVVHIMDIARATARFHTLE